MSTSVSTTQLNLRIISIVVFTCICYLSIGLPLAGWVAGFYDLATLYLLAAIVVALAFLLIFRVHRQQRLVARE